jgi:hypothetical protein
MPGSPSTSTPLPMAHFIRSSETGGVIWFERIVHADGTVQEVTTLVDLDGEVPVEQQFMDQNRLPQTLELMSYGRCFEIHGMDQTAAP